MQSFKREVFSVKHRKKFVKQLMAKGLDRNAANMCAAYSRHRGETYTHGLARFRQIMATIEGGAAV